MLPRTVLLTGGARFIGSHLAEKLLAAGHEVWYIDNLDPYYDPDINRQNLGKAASHPRFHFIEVDRTADPRTWQVPLRDARVDAIIHLAARAGVRQKRKDGMFLRKIPSTIANAIIRRSTGVYLHDYGCTLKVFESSVAKNLGLYGQLHRYIPVLAALQGARMMEMPVRHHARVHGTSKYGLGRTFKVISDLFLMIFMQKYFQRPMHLFGPLGFLCLFAGAGINLYLLVFKLQGQDIGNRPLLILGVILFLSGLQLLLFGIPSEVTMRTYYESQEKTSYRIREIVTGKKSGA